jgi:hypothetical protein
MLRELPFKTIGDIAAHGLELPYARRLLPSNRSDFLECALVNRV